MALCVPNYSPTAIHRSPYSQVRIVFGSNLYTVMPPPISGFASAIVVTANDINAKPERLDQSAIRPSHRIDMRAARRARQASGTRSSQKAQFLLKGHEDKWRSPATTAPSRLGQHSKSQSSVVTMPPWTWFTRNMGLQRLLLSAHHRRCR